MKSTDWKTILGRNFYKYPFQFPTYRHFLMPLQTVTFWCLCSSLCSRRLLIINNCAFIYRLFPYFLSRCFQSSTALLYVGNVYVVKSSYDSPNVAGKVSNLIFPLTPSRWCSSRASCIRCRRGHSFEHAGSYRMT